MKPASMRWIATLFCVLLLHACGGGGGGGSDAGQNGRISLSTTSASASASPGDVAPESLVVLTITNSPLPLVYYSLDHSRNGLEVVSFTQTGPAQAELRIRYKSPGSLANGTYGDTVTIHICADNQCLTDLQGSPATVRTSYVVSGTGPTSATISHSTIELTADQRETLGRRQDITATLNALPPAGIYVTTSHTSNAVEFTAEGPPQRVTSMQVGFVAGAQRALGTYQDTVTVNVCYDSSCVRQVGGSPFTIATTLHVTLGVEPGLPTLPILSREALGHDIIDAEYSAAMNAIVMVGSYPQDSIYVFDIDTGIESEQPLGMAPTALSVSPDGLTAAVGHAGFISVVDLAQVGSAGAPAPPVLNVSIPVNDIALDGSGNVYAVPVHEQGDNIHAVAIATNTEQQVPGFVERIRLQPGAPSLYALPDLPPNPLSKWDVSSGLPSDPYDWPYDRNRDACNDLWFSEPGDRIYTGCGQTFTTDADPAQDMIFAGSIPLTQPADRDNNYIQALSHSQAEGEIALIEWHFFDCRIGPLYRPCYTRLATFDDATYSQTGKYGIGPVTIGNNSFAQRGRYVFHDTQSTRKYLISELEGAPSLDQKYWISVIE